MSGCATCGHRSGYHFREAGECAFVNDEQDSCRCQHYVAPPVYAEGGYIGPGDFPVIEHPAPFVIPRGIANRMWPAIDAGARVLSNRTSAGRNDWDRMTEGHKDIYREDFAKALAAYNEANK